LQVKKYLGEVDDMLQWVTDLRTEMKSFRFQTHDIPNSRQARYQLHLRCGDCKETEYTADLFTTTFSPYLLRFFTVNYAQRLNLTILRLNKHHFFKFRLYHKIRNIELTR
jgi:hypothetical protein